METNISTEIEPIGAQNHVTFMSCTQQTNFQGIECLTLWLEDSTTSDHEELLHSIEEYDTSKDDTTKRRKMDLKKVLQKLFGRRLTSCKESSRHPTRTHRLRLRRRRRNLNQNLIIKDDEVSLASTAAMTTGTLSPEDTLRHAGSMDETDESPSTAPTRSPPELWTVLQVVAQVDQSHQSDATDTLQYEAYEIVLEHALTKENAGYQHTELSAMPSLTINVDESEPQSCLMAQRLLATGLFHEGDFEFVPDYVSKEVLHLREEKKEDEYDPTRDENVSHVKTGIWEVTLIADDGTPKEPYYVVTGVCMEDRVDTKRLRKVLFEGQTHKRRSKLALAPTSIAEELAGYKSGTMAPICHSQNLKLFLEERIVENVDETVHRVHVGSGMFGKCLSISVKNFLDVARSNPEGVNVCSIVQKAKSKKS